MIAPATRRWAGIIRAGLPWAGLARLAGRLAVVGLLLAASCMNLRTTPLGYRLGCAMERDGVLPDGAVWRESPSSNYVCVFGVEDPVAQDRVVEGARESLRRMGATRSRATVQFWSGEPPPRGVGVTVKEQAPIEGEPPPTDVARRNERYGISLVRAVKIEASPGDWAR